MSRLLFESPEPGVVVIVLEGEHDLYTATKLRERLEELVAEGVTLVVDLTRAEFVDSTVASALLDARQLAAGADVPFTVVVAATTGEPVRRMFEITGLGRILPVVEAGTVAPSPAQTPPAAHRCP